jgi:hypothetical protein
MGVAEGARAVNATAVVITVGEIQRTEGSGSLFAQAEVLLGIAGLDILLCGVQVRRTPDNRLHVQAPRYKHCRTGEWLPAVIMDPEITSAIASEVLDALRIAA